MIKRVSLSTEHIKKELLFREKRRAERLAKIGVFIPGSGVTNVKENKK